MNDKTMQLNNENFHKGFYENTKENIITQLLKIEDSNSSEEFKRSGCCYNAEMFLHGICHIFAYALHQKFGYDILEIRNSCMVHWCCVSDYNGKELYIDVRGATTNYYEFLAEFQPGMGKNPLKRIINEKELMLYEDEWREEGQLKFANEIIGKYYNYYSSY